ncbi:MAG: hypothetical protein IBJ03_01785 [Gemmatimonadaceae bacterium]|nr:hypothetical protein [Gemmatimonadaceae bacterium]
MTPLQVGDVAANAQAHEHTQALVHPLVHHHQLQFQMQHRRLAVALLLVTSSMAACTDASPAAPSFEAADAAQMSPVLVAVVDDATSRLLAGLPTDSPVQTAFGALRSALASHDTPAALRAAADAQLALDFSQAAHSIDAADRDALALQLSVVRAQLAPEAR